MGLEIVGNLDFSVVRAYGGDLHTVCVKLFLERLSLVNGELGDVLAVNAAQLHVSHAVCLAGGYLTVNAVGGFVGEGGIEKSCHICTTFPYNNYKLILYIICAYFKSEEVGFTKYFRLVKEKPADSGTYGRRLLQFSLMSVCAASK